MDLSRIDFYYTLIKKYGDDREGISRVLHGIITDYNIHIHEKIKAVVDIVETYNIDNLDTHAYNSPDYLVMKYLTERMVQIMSPKYSELSSSILKSLITRDKPNAFKINKHLYELGAEVTPLMPEFVLDVFVESGVSILFERYPDLQKSDLAFHYLRRHEMVRIALTSDLPTVLINIIIEYIQFDIPEPSAARMAYLEETHNKMFDLTRTKSS
jgi:hypothetical protein